MIQCLTSLIEHHKKNEKRVARSLLLGLAFMAIGFLSPPIKAETFDSNELKLKILYLYNFSKLTQWPATAFTAKDSPFNICIYANSNYSNIAKALQKKRVKHHPIRISTITMPEQVATCHTLFMSKITSEANSFLKQAYRHNVLTVGDDVGFIQYGGVIELTTINNKIRFEINLGAIKNEKLKISSKLLRLARTIHRKKILD